MQYVSVMSDCSIVCCCCSCFLFDVVFVLRARIKHIFISECWNFSFVKMFLYSSYFYASTLSSVFLTFCKPFFDYAESWAKWMNIFAVWERERQSRRFSLTLQFNEVQQQKKKEKLIKINVQFYDCLALRNIQYKFKMQHYHRKIKFHVEHFSNEHWIRN